MKAYRVQICNIATDDDVSCYFTYPPTKRAILTSLELQTPSASINRCISLVEDYGEKLQFVTGNFPESLHGSSDSYIEVSLIECHTNEDLLDRSHRLVSLSRELQSLCQETRRLNDERKRIHRLMDSEVVQGKLVRRSLMNASSQEILIKL